MSNVANLRKSNLLPANKATTVIRLVRGLLVVMNVGANLSHPSHHIAPCYAYRFQREDESELDYSPSAANELEVKILELGVDNVMAFVTEPIIGATDGAVPATLCYFKRIREICDRHDVLLIMGEVMY